jgi:hypothetical protein
LPPGEFKVPTRSWRETFFRSGKGVWGHSA